MLKKKKKLFSNQHKRKFSDFTESISKIINHEILNNSLIENIIENVYTSNTYIYLHFQKILLKRLKLWKIVK
jgi:spore germination protein YaaH